MLKKLEHSYGIDLGTTNTVIFERGSGIVLQEPSVVAYHERTGEIVAVGTEAQAMVGRSPAEVKVDYPLKSGVIANFDMTGNMLRQFMKKIQSRPSWFRRTAVFISVPCGITNVQKRAVEEIVFHKGAQRSIAVEEPLAAAIGAGLPIHEPVGHLVLAIGGGTSQAAVLSLGGIVASHTIPRGGRFIDIEIIEYVKRKHNLEIGERSAEQLKIAVGSARLSSEERYLEVRGRDVVAGLPRTVRIASSEVFGMIDDFVNRLIEAIRSTIEGCPPELAGDVMEQGILLCGGGALLEGIDERIRIETGIPVHIADRPLECAAIGTGMMA